MIVENKERENVVTISPDHGTLQQYQMTRVSISVDPSVITSKGYSDTLVILAVEKVPVVEDLLVDIVGKQIVQYR